MKALPGPSPLNVPKSVSVVKFFGLRRTIRRNAEANWFREFIRINHACFKTPYDKQDKLMEKLSKLMTNKPDGYDLDWVKRRCQWCPVLRIPNTMDEPNQIPSMLISTWQLLSEEVHGHTLLRDGVPEKYRGKVLMRDETSMALTLHPSVYECAKAVLARLAASHTRPPDLEF